MIPADPSSAGGRPVDHGPSDPPGGVVAAGPWGLIGAVSVTAAAIGGQFLVAVLVGAFTRAVLLLLDPNLADQQEALDRLVIRSSLLPAVIGSAMLTLGLVHVAVRASGFRTLREAIGIGPVTPATGGFLLAGIAVATASMLLMAFFPPEDLESLGGPMTELARSGPLGHAIWVALAVIVAPLVEEVLFRGYAFAGARRALGPAGAGVAVTAVFVALHLGETGAFWPALIGISAIGTLLVVIAHVTGNLTHCIACHLGYNAALAGVSFLGG